MFINKIKQHNKDLLAKIIRIMDNSTLAIGGLGAALVVALVLLNKKYYYYFYVIL
jgi:hypothetical protein